MATELQFLNSEGLATLVGKIKESLNNKANTKDVQPKGNYAILGDNGKILTSQIPGSVSEIVEFAGMVSGVTVETSSSTASSTDTGYSVVYDKTKNVFLLKDASTIAKYYTDWKDALSYQNNSTPYKDKLYTNGEKVYRWSGSTLVDISSTSGGVALGETSTTAYAGDKGAKNAKDIEAIKNGDLPLIGLSVGKYDSNGTASCPWTITKADDSETVSTTATGNLSTIYGYSVSFVGNYIWKSVTGYKDPTAVNGGNWASYSLPASGIPSSNITISNITDNRTFTASFKAPKQGLILSNGIIKEANSTDYDTKSASISVSFLYKIVASASETIPNASTLATLLNPKSQGTYNLQSGKNKTLTSVTTSNSEYYVYAFPSKLGTLSKIMMNDATPLLSDGFTLTQVVVTDPETTKTLEYNVYTSVQKGAFSNAKLDIA